jgi:hypothetical protein
MGLFEIDLKKGRSMRCSGCGKDVPFSGAVCPYCLRDKSKDQQAMVWAFCLGAIFAVIGGNLFGFWAGVGGLVLGGVVAIAIVRPHETVAPVVRVEKNQNGNISLYDEVSKVENMSRVPQSIEERLLTLKNLRDREIISEDEYNQRRKIILEEI